MNRQDGAPERGAGAPVSGDATAEARIGPAEFKPARSARSGVAPTPQGAGTAPPSAGQTAKKDKIQN